MDIIQQITAADTWDLRRRVMWPNKPKLYVQLPEDSKGIHFGLYVHKELTTVVSLFVQGNSIQFRKLATENQRQANGYGSKLLSHILTYAATLDCSLIWCNARLDKVEFYKKFGMYITDKTFIKGGIQYIIMEKSLK